MFAAGYVALMLSGAIPQSAEQELRNARSLAVVEDIGKHVSVAPDGSRVGAVDHGKQAARLIDAETGEIVDTPHEGHVHSLAIASRGQGYWLGLADGRIVEVAKSGEQRAFEAIAGKAVDGLQVHAGLVAWSSSAADRGGVLDARSGEPLIECATAIGGYRQPRMWLTRDARLAVHLAKNPDQGGRVMVVACDARTGKQVATMPSYISKRDCGFVFGVDRLLCATRAATHDWHLRELDLTSFSKRTVDDELRGKHFVDLFLAPSEKFLLEGDFEERGAVLYELGPNGGKRTLGGKGVMPVGFLRAREGREELALTTAARRQGLAAWSVATGEMVVNDLAFATGKKVTRVGSLRRGSGLWMYWWEARDRAAIGHLEVITVREQ